MFMLMAPLAMALRMRTGKDYTLYILAVCCGGTVTHSMTVPHPGPVAVVESLNLNVGESLVGGMAIGAITCFFGFMVSKWLNARTEVPLRETNGLSLDELKGVSAKPESELPSFFWSMTPVLLPIFLISLTTVFELAHGAAATGTGWGVSMGEPARRRGGFQSRASLGGLHRAQKHRVVHRRGDLTLGNWRSSVALGEEIGSNSSAHRWRRRA